MVAPRGGPACRGRRGSAVPGRRGDGGSGGLAAPRGCLPADLSGLGDPDMDPPALESRLCACGHAVNLHDWDAGHFACSGEEPCGCVYGEYDRDTTVAARFSSSYDRWEAAELSADCTRILVWACRGIPALKEWKPLAVPRAAGGGLERAVGGPWIG